MTELLPRLRRDRVLLVLAALLCAGLALRVWFMLVWSPAITGYSDTGVYFQDSVQSIWTDPVRTQGYTIFLRVLHAITPHLLFVTIVQHGMGLLAAALIYFAVRRCGGPRWLGLVPAAMVALGGDELFIEHSALSDALFTFLVVAMLYCAVRVPGARGRWIAAAGWAALAGLLTGLIVWDRGAGLAMVPLVPLWLVFHRGRPTRNTLAIAAVSFATTVATVGVYVVWRESESGLSGLTTNSAWNLYGRVAPWANCASFTPPAGTQGLCEYDSPSVRNRHTAGEYIYNSESPAQKMFGVPYLISSYPHAMELMQNWSEAAILGQPLEYLHAIWLDTVRLFDPGAHSYGDLSANELIGFLLYGPDMHSGQNEFVESWQRLLYPHDPPPHHGDMVTLRTWEETTRVDGAWMGILLALLLAGPWLLSRTPRARVTPEVTDSAAAPHGTGPPADVPGPRASGPSPRAGMILFGVAALLLLFFPILASSYDYRYVIPAIPPLVAAGTLSAWGLALRVREAWPRAGRLLGRAPAYRDERERGKSARVAGEGALGAGESAERQG
ncbi:MAG: hypothetical protein ACYDA6_06780, partial [Solirubrobacteraceae bacterium]